jgi:transcriptional regulator with PAS, ATPase and Fis domain
VQGESGTGKELVARAVFEGAGHRDGPFVDVNCAALSESLLEAELFGHEKGAFTGATATRPGLFEAADGGAVFLDEIGEMPLSLQPKLLRVLEQRSLKRVGGVENVPVSCQIIASSNRNLGQMVQEGGFRKDLFYRLNVFTVEVPPLRERGEDIPVLCEHFRKRFAAEYDREVYGFTPAAARDLASRQWPGNVRELRNVVERAVVVASGRRIGVEDLAAPYAAVCESSEESGGLSSRSLEEVEKLHIRRVLEATEWHKKRAAEILGINRTTLWYKIKQFGLQKD